MGKQDRDNGRDTRTAIRAGRRTRKRKRPPGDQTKGAGVENEEGIQNAEHAGQWGSREECREIHRQVPREETQILGPGGMPRRHPKQPDKSKLGDRHQG